MRSALLGVLYVVGLAVLAADVIAIDVVAAAVLLGLLVGLVAEILFLLRRKRPKLVGAISVVAVVHGLLVWGSMARSPALYAPAFYDEGGLARTVQVLATDVLGTGGIAVIALAAAVLYVGARRLLRRVGVFAIVALGVSCSGRPSTPAGDWRPNVLVVGVDGLRADRLDLMTSLASLEAMRFDRAYVTIPSAVPSWVTLLTGRPPHHHGIRTAYPTTDARTAGMDALPERFAKAGFATVAVSDRPGGALGTIGLGFSRVVQPPAVDPARRRALARQTPLLPLLDSSLGRWLFPAMDAVAPDPVRTARRAVAELPKEPWLAAVALTVEPAGARDPKYRGRFKYAVPGWVRDPDADDVRMARAHYDEGVRAVDRAIGELLSAVDLDRTIVVVTGVRGASLFERVEADGLAGDETTHVPLLLHVPKGRSGREARIVRDVHVAPLFYAFAGVSPPADLDAGPEGVAVAESDGGARMPGPTLLTRQRMVRDERWKLVYVPERKGVKYMLFDTASDPEERADVAAEHPEEVKRLRVALWSFLLGDLAMEARGGFLVPRGSP